MLEVVGPGRTRAALGLPASRMQSGSGQGQGGEQDPEGGSPRSAHTSCNTRAGPCRGSDRDRCTTRGSGSLRMPPRQCRRGHGWGQDKSEWKGSSQLWQSRSVWTMVPQTGGGRAAPVTTPLVSPLWLGFVPLDVFIQQVLLG